jgi:hypothetical protein
MPRLRLPGLLAVLTASLLFPGASSASPTGTWSDLTPYHPDLLGDEPPVNYVSVYDPVRDRIVLFGGLTCSHEGNFPSSDTWSFDLTTRTWQIIATQGGIPPARDQACGVYDSVHDRLVIFGGRNGSTVYADLWALSLSGTPTWTELTPAGLRPSGLAGASAIYDSQRQRMVIFGGVLASGLLQNLSFALDLSDDHWTQIVDAGVARPSPRRGHVAVYDNALDRMLIFGGSNVADTSTYAYYFADSSWSPRLPTTGTVNPAVATGIFDPVRNRLIVAGATTQILDLGTNTWTALPGPVPNITTAAAYDPTRDLMVVDELHVLDLTNLTWRAHSHPQPSVRANHTAIYDPTHGRMVLYGGRGEAEILGDLWTFDASGTVGWAPLAAAGTPPLSRFAHTAIYDPIRDRMIAYGGQNPYDVELSDVWALSLSGTPQWTELHPLGDASPPHSFHTAIYDPVQDRMVVWGGSYGL